MGALPGWLVVVFGTGGEGLGRGLVFVREEVALVVVLGFFGEVGDVFDHGGLQVWDGVDG